MEFIPTLDTYENDQAVRTLWSDIAKKLEGVDGICYYKHPIIESATCLSPDLALLAENYHPVIIKALSSTIDEISEVENTTWTVSGTVSDSPFLEIDDFLVSLLSKFERQRILRRRFNPIGVLYLPLVTKHDFESKFGPIDSYLAFSSHDIICVCKDRNLDSLLINIDPPLKPIEWLTSKSVFQGINPLNKQITEVPINSATMGGAISLLEKQIALLDEEQHKVAIQMAPGPQRIRGLAGTGKTVVLAMKAANIHRRYPDKNILFTFNTQSLYNQAKKLITKFFREYSDSDPDWEKIHLRHGWGGASRPGVYYDLCRRMGLTPFTFQHARSRDYEVPIRACCQEVLKHNIEPFYDFILVDEAQDFPKEFFMVLARLITPEKRIYFAYDELQSLTAVEIPRAEDMFGFDKDGQPFISVEGPDYPGGIEKDFVLHKSYRCPLDALMLAHGIGLGIHGPHGCVQMLGNQASWESIGYEVEEGTFAKNTPTTILRPAENSPNRIRDIYNGHDPLLDVKKFDTREQELTWVASSIEKTINEEQVKPEDIMVICLDVKKSKDCLVFLQRRLQENEVESMIPGLVDQSWKFAEPGRVTLSTVYRAKGNEAPVVYIIAFDALYSYVEEIESRNRAFTSISRSKGWLRITGSGGLMNDVDIELTKIVSHIPRFRFLFPDMENIRIRKLDASETSRRRKEVGKARSSLKTLLNLDKEALKDIDPKLLKKLKNMIGGVSGESD